MKKLLLLTLVVCFGFFNSYSQTTFKEIASTLIDVLKVIKDIKHPCSPVDVTSQTINVNSRTKIGGKQKGVVHFVVPPNTSSIAVRITVAPIKLNYHYIANESFFSLLQQGHGDEVANFQNDKIYFSLFNRSFDATGFLSNLKSEAIFVKYSNSFISQIEVPPGDYWIGILNDNATEGLEVIVEVVALVRH